MSIEDFKGLLDSIDPAGLLPELDAVLGKIVPITRFAVLVGPVVLLLMGLLYIFASPKEANHYLGYRCYYGMGSVEAWRFTQRLAGIVWAALGLVLALTMLIISGSFREMEIMDLLWKAVYCVGLEAILTALACIGVNIAVAARFDGKGNARRKAVRRR